MTDRESAGPPRSTDPVFTVADLDDELLSLVSEVLRRSSYEVVENRELGFPILLGENADNVLAATATVTVDAAVLIEPVLSRLLVQQMGDHDLEEKKWDGYVALLTSQAASVAVTEPLFGIAYNLRHVRRLIKVGVEPTLAAVERALRPVLALPKPPASDGLTDPIALLEARLVQAGIDAQAVEGAVARFRAVQGGYTIAEDDDEPLPEDVS